MLPDGREVRISPDELAAMKSYFQLFDSDGDGKITCGDLRALHAKLGEPISEGEAADAVAMIGGEASSSAIDFNSFLAYWDGTHPSLRKAADASAEAAERERKRAWYSARFKFIKARLPQASLGRIFTETVGTCPSLDYRVFFFYDGGAEHGKVPISPWHDIPYKNGDGTFNAVIEIPRWSRAKFEVATGELYNPIRQDVKNGVLREFGWGDLSWNYGCLPQSYESPDVVSPDTGCPGDNDPLDVVEIGNRMWPVGSIVSVKVLGVLGLIDAGETDWKIIAISAEDPLAESLNDLEDIEVHMPGLLPALHRWFRLYKAPVINEFAFAGAARGREYATHIVEDCHAMWERLVDEHMGGEARAGAPSIVSAGLKRSTSKSKLAHIFAGGDQRR